MKIWFSYCLILIFSLVSVLKAQTASTPAYTKKLKRLYSYTVPLLSPEDCEEILSSGKEFYLLDTRAPREYQVSHLPGAIFFDFGRFDEEDFEEVDRGATVVVYCTVGYRSENVGEKLQKLGFHNVYNLYGGILEWKNQGFGVVDNQGKPTEKVHTYSRKWGQWMLNSAGEKVH